MAFFKIYLSARYNALDKFLGGTQLEGKVLVEVAPVRSEQQRAPAFGSRWGVRSFDRVLDLALGLPVLLLFLPIMLLVALSIYLADGGPVIFAQPRVGKGRRSFRCLKFRSMHVHAERELAQVLARDSDARREWAETHKLRLDPRITRIGGFIRKHSLDELPQLLNVMIGDMSLVGPRPIVEVETPHYGHRLHHYCSVRPGLTGIWQVSGRSDVSYRSRVAMDVTYARSKSTALDLRLLLATIPAVLLSRGSY